MTLEEKIKGASFLLSLDLDELKEIKEQVTTLILSKSKKKYKECCDNTFLKFFLKQKLGRVFQPLPEFSPSDRKYKLGRVPDGERIFQPLPEFSTSNKKYKFGRVPDDERIFQPLTSAYDTNTVSK